MRSQNNRVPQKGSSQLVSWFDSFRARERRLLQESQDLYDKAQAATSDQRPGAQAYLAEPDLGLLELDTVKLIYLTVKRLPAGRRVRAFKSAQDLLADES